MYMYIHIIIKFYACTWWYVFCEDLEYIVWFCSLVFGWVHLLIKAETNIRLQTVWSIVELKDKFKEK